MNNYADSMNNNRACGNQRISNLNGEIVLHISPNPVRDNLNIYFVGNTSKDRWIELNVSNSIGQKVIQKRFEYSNIYSLDVSNLANGVYHIILNIENEIITKKLTKM